MSETEAASTPTKPSTPTTPSTPGKSERSREAEPQAVPVATGVPLIIALLALGLSIGLLVAAYFTWNQVQQMQYEQSRAEDQQLQRLEPVTASVETLSDDLQTSHQQLRHSIEQLDPRFEKLDQDQQNLSHRMGVLAALIGRSEQGWGLAEVEYLLRIANQRLQLQRDIHSAEEALRSADRRLHQLADPYYLSVREEIARELEALGALPDVDLDGLSLSLSTWLERLDELPVAGAVYQPADTQQLAFDSSRTAQDWRELPEVVWASLSELFRMRTHDAPVRPMLPPEQSYFLRENLRLQIAAARLALLRQDSAQFRATLSTARGWLSEYFSAEHAQVQQLAAELERLRAVDIHPPLPDISASLKLLHTQLELSEQQEILPVVPEPVQKSAVAPSAEPEPVQKSTAAPAAEPEPVQESTAPPAAESAP